MDSSLIENLLIGICLYSPIIGNESFAAILNEVILFYKNALGAIRGRPHQWRVRQKRTHRDGGPANADIAKRVIFKLYFINF